MAPGGFTSIDAAETAAQEMRANGKATDPLILAVQIPANWKKQPELLLNGAVNEFKVDTLVFETDDINYASLLYLNNGVRTWEYLESGRRGQMVTSGAFQVTRRPLDPTDAHLGLPDSGAGPFFKEYFLVSPIQDMNVKK